MADAVTGDAIGGPWICTAGLGDGLVTAGIDEIGSLRLDWTAEISWSSISAALIYDWNWDDDWG